MNKVVVVVTAVVASLGLSVASFFVGRHFGKKAVPVNQPNQSDINLVEGAPSPKPAGNK